MKRLVTIAGVSVLIALVAALGIGFAVVRIGGRDFVVVLRDLSIMLLALYALIAAVVAGGIFGGGAWAMERFGSKVVVGAAWVRRKTLQVEGLATNGLEKAVVRPLANTTQAVTMTKTFTAAAAGFREPASEAKRYPMRVVTGLVRQLRRSPAPPTRQNVPGAMSE
jgi:hypothetical protein